MIDNSVNDGMEMVLPNPTDSVLGSRNFFKRNPIRIPELFGTKPRNNINNLGNGKPVLSGLPLFRATEMMERSTKILVFLLIVALAITAVALAAPGSVQNFAEGTIIAPVVTAFVGFVAWLDGFRASYLLAGGIIGGLFLAILIKRVDIPKKIRQVRNKPLPPKDYGGAPEYVPPQQIQPKPVAVTPQPVIATPPAEDTTNV
jgi:hypothetical protein